MRKILFSALLITLILTGCTNKDITTKEVEESTISNNIQKEIFEFSEKEYDFGVIKQSGGIVSHKFEFVYNGDETIEIDSVLASCACTEGEVDKKEFRQGDTGVLTVYFNPNLHAEPEGRFYKTVSIITSPKMEDIPEVRVWVEIDLDLGEEYFELSNKDDGAIHVSNIAHNGMISPLSKGYSKDFTLTIKEVRSELDSGLEYAYWTYDETVPGPFLRAKVGDNIKITLKNDKNNQFPHSIDLHAVNGPGGGALATSVSPGEEKSFEFEALNPGVYIYHCATPEVAEHMANGMYGLIVIEPVDGYSEVDREFYVVQGEVYSVSKRGDKGHTQLSGEKLEEEDPEYIVFNGKKNALVGKNALQAEVGDKVRIFVGNGGVSKISNFHVIGEVFDTVYPEGGTPVLHDIQTTLVPAGGATIVEFTLNASGVYKLVDHALSRLNKGALAELRVK